jgi:hypothetical protein
MPSIFGPPNIEQRKSLRTSFMIRLGKISLLQTSKIIMFSLKRSLEKVSSSQFRTLTSASLLSQNPAIKYRPDWDFPINECQICTDLIEDLASARVEDLPNSQLKAVVLKRSILFSEDEAFARNVLYIRHHHELLLEKVRSVAFSTLLLGSPGTAKSMFQYYYLLRMVNPYFKSELPPTKCGRTQLPDMVIREVAKMVELYDIKNLKGYSMKNMDARLLRRLDPDKALYFFDPVQSRDGPTQNHHVPILATMDPNPVRYHGFKKKNPSRLYCPLWTLEELKAVHKHMNTAHGVIDPPSQISEQEIESNYREFGGIIRHVICKQRALEWVREKQQAEIQKVNWQDRDIVPFRANHMIMCYKVKTEGNDAYMKFDIDFVSQDVSEAVWNKKLALNILDID